MKWIIAVMAMVMVGVACTQPVSPNFTEAVIEDVDTYRFKKNKTVTVRYTITSTGKTYTKSSSRCIGYPRIKEGEVYLVNANAGACHFIKTAKRKTQ